MEPGFFISSNIVNTKYVQEIDFKKYYGTFFTLIPLYLVAIIKERYNLMLNVPIFESPKDSQRNGGYGVCTVFVENYLKIFREFVDRNLLSESLYVFEKSTALNFVKGFVVKYYILNNQSNFKEENTWFILFSHYGKLKVIFEISKCMLKYFYRKTKSILGK